MSEYTVVNITPRSRLRTSPLEEKEVVIPTVKDLSFESAYDLAKNNLLALKRLRGEALGVEPTPLSKGSTMSKPTALTEDAEHILTVIEGGKVSSTFSDAQVAQALADYLYRLSDFDSKTALAKHHNTSTRSLDRWLTHYEKMQASTESPQEPLGVLGDVFAPLTAQSSQEPFQEPSPPPIEVAPEPPSEPDLAPQLETLSPAQVREEAQSAEVYVDIRQPQEILDRKDSSRLMWESLSESQQKALALAHKTRSSYSGSCLPQGVLDAYGLVKPAYRPFVEELVAPYIDSATLKVRGESFELLTSLTDQIQLSAEEVIKRALKTLAQAYAL